MARRVHHRGADGPSTARRGQPHGHRDAVHAAIHRRRRLRGIGCPSQGPRLWHAFRRAGCRDGGRRLRTQRLQLWQASSRIGWRRARSFGRRLDRIAAANGRPRLVWAQVRPCVWHVAPARQERSAATHGRQERGTGRPRLIWAQVRPCIWNVAAARQGGTHAAAWCGVLEQTCRTAAWPELERIRVRCAVGDVAAETQAPELSRCCIRLVRCCPSSFADAALGRTSAHR